MFLFKNFKSLTIKGQMLILSAIFIVINLVAILYEDLEYVRIARVSSTVAVVLFFIFQIGIRKKWSHLVYPLLLFSSLGFYYFDFTYGRYLHLSSTICSYVIIAFLIINGIRWSKIKRYEYVAYLFIFIIHIIFHTYNVFEFKEKIYSDKEFFLLLLTGWVGLTTCLLAAFSNATRTSFKSAYLMYATFAFIFADFAAMVAYYYELFPMRFYFIERGCYLFGMYILTRYFMIVKDEQQSENTIAQIPSQDSTFL